MERISAGRLGIAKGQVARSANLRTTTQIHTPRNAANYQETTNWFVKTPGILMHPDGKEDIFK